MSTTVPDRIEKRLVLRAPRSHVWRAITDAGEFGKWFGVALEGPFTEATAVRGKITHPGYEHLTMEVFVERSEPERHFSFRWHPGAIDPKTDYSQEPTTFVEFSLEESAEGTILTIVESGFDRIPLARRADAFRLNDGGWTEQLRNIERHVARQ